MAPIDDAIAAIESREPGEHFTCTEIAKTFNVSRVTLARRYQGSQGLREAKKPNQQALNPKQERELCSYVEGLTKQGFSPTRETYRISAPK